MSDTKNIIIDSFNISLGNKILYEKACLKILHKRRYGFIGPNGNGKSTLLKYINDRKLTYPLNINVLYVEQEIEGTNISAYKSVLAGDIILTQLQEEETKLIDILENYQDNTDNTNNTKNTNDSWTITMDRLNEVSNQLLQLQANSAESRARQILSGLGFNQQMQETSTNKFSGGWRMRIALAKALFVSPDLLLLDEPTNHLDLKAVIWLTDYLCREFKKKLVVISHDQDFLNSVATDIILLQNMKLVYFSGDYDSFAYQKQNLDKQQIKQYDKQQKQIATYVKSGISKKQAEQMVCNNQKPNKLNKLNKLNKPNKPTKLNKSKNEPINDPNNEIKNKLIDKFKEYIVKICFNDIPDNRACIKMENCSFKYNIDSELLFSNINFGINTALKIVIVGQNGAGKSTMLKLLAGYLKPTDGIISYEDNAKIGYYNQHFNNLPQSITPVKYLISQSNESEFEIRKLLRQFGVKGSSHLIPISELSGGQKARVVFVSLYLMRPYFLLLDEPTNHLDIESTNSLIQSIKQFNGGIIVITHDARLIIEANLDIWLCCSNEKNIIKYNGNFNDYKNEILMELKSEKEIELKRQQDRIDQKNIKKSKLSLAR